MPILAKNGVFIEHSDLLIHPEYTIGCGNPTNADYEGNPDVQIVSMVSLMTVQKCASDIMAQITIGIYFAPYKATFNFF